MEGQNTLRSTTPQGTLSREELEQHLRARVWKDDVFRQEFLTNPQAVLQRDYAHSFPDGIIPSQLSIKVIEEEEQTICFVLPTKPSNDGLAQSESIEDKELIGVSGGAFDSWYCTDPRFTDCCGKGYSQLRDVRKFRL